LKSLFPEREDGQACLLLRKKTQILFEKGEIIMGYRAEISSEFKDYYALEVNHIWTISNSVGWGNNNFYGDVVLVQYLLNKCAGKKLLETDGLFGPKTSKAIKNFQNSVNNSMVGVCSTDGRVTAADGETITTQVNYVYTIHMLNWLFYLGKRIYYNDPRIDPDLPTSLCVMVSDYF
jgi:hypothetical protein